MRATWWWVGTAAVLMLSPLAGQELPAKQPGKKGEKLKVGDPAPALKADKWWNGPAVSSLEKGKVYVVEFWATWCGPCIVMMPHMSELQEQYKDKGVIFIGYTAKDPNNDLNKVSEFVSKRGSKLHYTLAYAETRDSYDAWMRAAGRTGIPCCFVVDRNGTIAYIGHPMYLDVVLPKVVAGKWTEADLEAVEKIEQEVSELFAASRNPEEFLKKIAAFEKKYPELANIPYFNPPRIIALLATKQFDAAKKTAEAIVTKAVKYADTGALQNVLAVLATNPSAAGNAELMAIAIKAGEGLVAINGDKDPISLYLLAEAHFAAGNNKKAQELGAKAVDNATGPLKSQLEQRIKRYQDKDK